MRKIYNICLFVGVIALMLSACKKDNQNQIVQNTGEEIYWTAEDLKIQNNILSFQDKIKNNSFKSGETLELDSAVWYLEALMNYNYSTPDSSFVNLTVDTTFEFNLPVNDDLVDFSNLSEAAFAMEEHIVNYLNNMPNSIKFMVVADVHIKDDDFKSGSKTISITTGYGSEYIDNPSAYTPFGEDDYWYYGDGYMDNGGYCDGPNEGQETGSDAAEEIEFKINNPNVSWDDPYPAGSYIVGLGDVFTYSSLYQAPDYDNDNWLDYLMYYEDDGLGNDGWPKEIDACLEPEEMNFYLQGTLDVIEMVIEEKQSEYPGENIEFIYVDLVGSIWVEDATVAFMHLATITYGKRVMRVPPTE
jgi:hypothetical protein